MNELWRKRLLRGWPFLVLGTLAVVFVFMLVFSRKAPVIASLDPPMAAPGQQVVVNGDYFGRTQREGTLSLAGEIPPPSLIQSWSDQKIVFVIPEDASSGLVMVSNSQGTSTGVLFTNTETIPTVLLSAGNPSQPLLWDAVPAQPVSGQLVTLSGRGFGFGDEAVAVKVTTPQGGPVLEVGPEESLVWSDRLVTFRWPPGAGPGTTVSVSTPRGDSSAFPLGGVGPVAWESPRTMAIEYRAKVSLPASTAVDLWGPVPQRSTGTAWSLGSSDPLPNFTPGRPSFSWPAGSAGERQVVYRLTLTTWAKRWDGFAAGTSPPSQDTPSGEDLSALWKPVAPALKTLAARWGLDTTDPWLRLQRLQTGLAASFQSAVVPGESNGLTKTPAELLAAAKLTSYEVSTLAVVLATQAGLAARLVGGLWLGDSGPIPRTWAEAWIPGAGWVSWDPIDGHPGVLDNRHFAFSTSTAAQARRLPRSKTFGPGPPGSLAIVSGESSGPGPEPVVQWQITLVEK